MEVRGNFMTRAECEKIHEMSVYVLEHVGVDFMEPYCREVFKSHGAKVEGERVYISREMLENALSTAPEVFTVTGRNGKSVTVGKENQILAPASGPLFVRRGNDRHRNTAEDYKNFQKIHHNSRVMDMLNPNLIEPADIARDIVRDYQMAVCLKYTDKPLIGLTTAPNHTINCIEMTQRFYGIKESVMLGIINVISPLKYDDTMLEAVKICAENHQPMMFACCSMPGATSPITLSSTVVVNNAEVLAGIVYAQLLSPGIGVLYGNTSGGCDLRFVTPTIGSPELALFVFASAAMAQYYKLPCRTGGALADSKLVDWQCGVESTMTMMASMISSSNFILHACGVMESFSTLSYEKFLLDEQNIEMLGKITGGIQMYMDQEELNNIAEVGPGGQYIDADHTLEYLHDELYTPKLFSKTAYAGWVNSGGKSAKQLAGEQIEERIASYKPVEITKEQEDVLVSYIGKDLYRSI